MAAGKYMEELFALLAGAGIDTASVDVLLIIGGLSNEIRAEQNKEIGRLREIESCARYMLHDGESARSWELKLQEVYTHIHMHTHIHIHIHTHTHTYTHSHIHK